MKKEEFQRRDKFVTCNGIELVEVRPGYALSRMVVGENHLNGGCVAHGGAIFTLADFTQAAAVNAHGKLSLTIQSNIRYLLASREGEVLTAQAKEVYINKRIAHYVVEVKNGEGRLVAIFESTCYRKDVDYDPDCGEQ